MQIPNEIVERVKNGQCILFLGAMASAPSPEGSRFQYKQAPPSGAKLSRRLAAKCGYPYQDVINLQRVSLYYQFRPGGSRQALVEAIKDEITRPEIVPSPVLHMLAALPFPIVITTNYDHLFDMALSRANTIDGRPKQPIIRVYDPTLTCPPEAIPPDLTEEKPILLKLHGDIDKPESIVVTEEDHIHFIRRMTSPHSHLIHQYILARLNMWPTLYIGYSLRDYNLRLLFRALRWQFDETSMPLSFSVNPFPDNLIASVMQYGTRPLVNFIREDLWDFVPALYREVMGVEYQP